MIEISWENIDEVFGLDEDPYLEDSNFQKLCQNSKPSDFYFDVKKNDGESCIMICPKAWFDKNGYCWEDGLNIDHLFPKDFEAADEYMWYVERPVKEVKDELLSLGFVNDKKFNDYANNNW